MSNLEGNPRWNPSEPIEVTPEAYERQVFSWLRSAGAGLPSFSITHLKKVQGHSGEYSIDCWIEFEILSGAHFSILVECKRHRRPLERDTILGVSAKAHDVGAQKCLIFSTSGFQVGAIEFAKSARIGLVNFIDGRLTYVTRSMGDVPVNSHPSDLPEFVGQILQAETGKISLLTIDDDRVEPLLDWLVS